METTEQWESGNMRKWKDGKIERWKDGKMGELKDVRIMFPLYLKEGGPLVVGDFTL